MILNFAQKCQSSVSTIRPVINPEGLGSRSFHLLLPIHPPCIRLYPPPFHLSTHRSPHNTIQAQFPSLQTKAKTRQPPHPTQPLHPKTHIIHNHPSIPLRTYILLLLLRIRLNCPAAPLTSQSHSLTHPPTPIHPSIHQEVLSKFAQIE